jgi:hypothetical protein
MFVCFQTIEMPSSGIFLDGSKNYKSLEKHILPIFIVFRKFKNLLQLIPIDLV